MRKWLILALVLCGCTINITDKRLSREEIRAAFDQRDKVLTGMGKEIKDLKSSIRLKKK